ncbi:MAG: hypothetical protein IKX30_18350 [Victivallales bacterium]|nr:hypothetical protein [Victivallales bacterium]
MPSTAGRRRYDACRQRRDAVVTTHAVNGGTPSLQREDAVVTQNPLFRWD